MIQPQAFYAKMLENWFKEDGFGPFNNLYPNILDLNKLNQKINDMRSIIIQLGLLKSSLEQDTQRKDADSCLRAKNNALKTYLNASALIHSATIVENMIKSIARFDNDQNEQKDSNN